MLKKAREARDAGKDSSGKEPSKSVLESSRQIWLAGLGAFSRAQAEGTKVFEALVAQGEAVETKTRRAAADTATAARHAAQSTAREVQQMAGGTWDKLEKVFEDRVARALSRLGVHTQSDVERLSQRVDALADAVNALIKTNDAVPSPDVTVRRGRRAAGSDAAASATAADTAKTKARASRKRAPPAKS